MKNYEGKSPLDIALDNESPRNVELMLNKITQFRDEKLSGLFYDRFNELLAMDIETFYEYLESWLFQTAQMKLTRYLDLKNTSFPLLVTHSSWLIDEVFVEKYCKRKKDNNLSKCQNVQIEMNKKYPNSKKITKDISKDSNETFQKMLNETRIDAGWTNLISIKGRFWNLFSI